MVAELPLAPASSARLPKQDEPTKVTPQSSSTRSAAGGNDGVWTFRTIDSAATSVCSADVCCSAYTTHAEAYGTYVLGALDGTDTSEGLKWGANVCAVMPCTSASSSCLNYHAAPSTPLTELRVEMSLAGSVARPDSVLPEVILSDTAGLQAPPSQFSPYVAGQATPTGEAQWSWDSARGSAVVALNRTAALDAAGLGSEAGVLSAVIYGRCFDKDVLPYSC